MRSFSRSRSRSLTSRSCSRFGRRRYIRPFSIVDAGKAKVFRGTVNSFQKRLAPLEYVDMTSQEMLPRFYFASNGLLRPLVEVLKEAVDLAYASKKRGVTLGTLQSAFRNVIWQEAPDNRNPFHPTFDTLPLTNHGEPYAVPERDL